MFSKRLQQGGAIDRLVQQGGLVLEHCAPTTLLGLDQCWLATFKFRNTLRQAQVDVLGFDAP